MDDAPDVDLFITPDGDIVVPNQDDPKWNEYLEHMLHISTATAAMFGQPGVTTYENVLGPLTVVCNLFMMRTVELKGQYLEKLYNDGMKAMAARQFEESDKEQPIDDTSMSNPMDANNNTSKPPKSKSQRRKRKQRAKKRATVSNNSGTGVHKPKGKKQ